MDAVGERHAEAALLQRLARLGNERGTAAAVSWGFLKEGQMAAIISNAFAEQFQEATRVHIEDAGKAMRAAGLQYVMVRLDQIYSPWAKFSTGENMDRYTVTPQVIRQLWEEFCGMLVEDEWIGEPPGVSFDPKDGLITVGP